MLTMQRVYAAEAKANTQEAEAEANTYEALAEAKWYRIAMLCQVCLDNEAKCTSGKDRLFEAKGKNVGLKANQFSRT